ncbi:MAG: class I SAM-dependent methyltransferase [Proteobacteria bacterium]|jgi:SAM-dependent methyltransferase|nr:class I SAM-dependent methyltransferase [Pseudomonadota bacterium]
MHVDRCALCGGAALETVIEFEELPVSDTLCRTAPKTPPPAHDQSFVACLECGHFQLGTWLEPDHLYGQDYGYRTSNSILGKVELSFFINALEKNHAKQHYRCVVEVGCNDLHLLERFRDKGNYLAGVDPILSDPTIQVPSGISVFPSRLDQATLDKALPEEPDLIICRHTLEHMADPAGTLRQFIDLLAPDGIAVVEIPCLDAMFARGRYDQIFHQHLHYFSRQRIDACIEAAGGSIVWRATSWQTWGAYIVAFSKDGAANSIRSQEPQLFATPVELRTGYRNFQTFMKGLGGHFQTLTHLGPVHGYGAAQMLPILAWHLGTDFEWMVSVLDDDQGKHGMRYANLPVGIECPESEDIWRDASIIVTAVDHATTLIRRLSTSRPKQIVVPLMAI